MAIDRYELTTGITALQYGFTSIGPKGSIPKLIQFTAFSEPNLFNLAFGDKDSFGEIDDLAVSDNGDTQRILFTVVSALYDFTSKNPDAVILITGSTPARTRLYQINISRYLHEVKKDFDVYGWVDDQWYEFEKHVVYKAFLVRKKVPNFSL